MCVSIGQLSNELETPAQGLLGKVQPPGSLLRGAMTDGWMDGLKSNSDLR